MNAERDLAPVPARGPDARTGPLDLAQLRQWLQPRSCRTARKKPLPGSTPTATHAPYIWFALFKELEDTERYEEAWEALVGLRSAAKPPGVQPHWRRCVVQCVHRAFLSGDPRPAAVPASRRSAAHPHRGHAAAGRHCRARILGAHSQVADAGELYDFPFQLRCGVRRPERGRRSMSGCSLRQPRSTTTISADATFHARNGARANGRSSPTKLPV